MVSEGVTPANPIITKVPPAYEIRRNSDGQTFEVYGGSGHQQTAVVYDAGVTSYAWGICLYQGSSFTARTINY